MIQVEKIWVYSAAEDVAQDTVQPPLSNTVDYCKDFSANTAQEEGNYHLPPEQCLQRRLFNVSTCSQETYTSKSITVLCYTENAYIEYTPAVVVEVYAIA